jgi:hypothetical protein
VVVTDFKLFINPPGVNTGGFFVVLQTLAGFLGSSGMVFAHFQVKHINQFR